MADFQIAYELTHRNEVGYTNNPKDRGNWTGGKRGVGVLIGTNDGISAPVLMRFLGKIPSVYEMKNLTREQKMHIYKNGYWKTISGDLIESQKIANAIYDGAVNMGEDTVSILVQRILGVEEDGDIGPNTLKELNEYPEEKFLTLLKLEKVKYYLAICLRDPSQDGFLKGWIKRAIS